MCGRYQIITDEAELRDIIFEAFKNCGMSETYDIGGEVYPTNLMPILISNQDKIIPVMSKWGFPRPQSSGVIINARSETVDIKPLFSSKMKYTRCVVPSSGFFEWSHSADAPKSKYLFYLPNNKILYMAGLYGEFNGESGYVIITSAANASMADIHDRMPLVLTREQLTKWLNNTSSALGLLHIVPPMLEKKSMPA